MNRPPALVLTAGLGTRLRPLTDIRAKAAVPVNGEALALRIARWLAARGFADQVFNLHHHPASITSLLGDGASVGVRVRYSWEHPVLGSAGGPRHALPLLTGGGAARFLIVNGDTLTNVDLDSLLQRHDASGARVTMALIPNPEPDKYGGVAIDHEHFVSGFTRKGAVRESFHFIGVQVTHESVFAHLEDGTPYESVATLYPEMMRSDPRAIAAFVSDATFSDIGTPADCLYTSIELSRSEGNRLVSSSAQIAADAVVERTALWDHVEVGRGAHLSECIVADGVRIPERARLTRCAIVPAGLRPPADDERLEHGLLIRPFT